MKRLLIVVLLIAVGVACLGYYLGWFRLDTDKTDGKTKITLTVDQQKILDAEKKAAEKVRDIVNPPKN